MPSHARILAFVSPSSPERGFLDRCWCPRCADQRRVVQRANTADAITARHSSAAVVKTQMNGSLKGLKLLPRRLAVDRQPTGLCTNHSRCRGFARSRMTVPAPVAAVAAPEKATPQKNLKTYTASEMTAEEVKACVARPRIDFTSILHTVTTIYASYLLAFDRRADGRSTSRPAGATHCGQCEG